MANKERGELRLAAEDGTEYTLRLTTNAACEMEERSGRLFDAIISGAGKGSLRDTRWLLWAALQDHHADVAKTANDVGLLIDRMGGILLVADRLTQLMKLNQDKASEKKAEGSANPPSAEAPTGASST